MRVVIVDRDYPATFQGLEKVFRDKSDVRLVWDRRRLGDRRAKPRYTVDRRGRPLQSWMQAHWVVVNREANA